MSQPSRSSFRSGVWLFVAAAAIGLLVSSVARSRAPDVRRLGFTAATFARQRPFEARFAASVSTTTLSDAHRALTRRPHRAGSDGAREVADYVRRELNRAGLDVEVTEYSAYLSEPRLVRVELIEPVREPLEVVEPPDHRDPDTSHPELDPAFVAYSPSGDVTADVVYVNYGLPADYAALKAAGVDVTGRIVVARYGRSHRAVKVYTAERAGAAAVILYSDPADDGSARGPTWPDGMWRAAHFAQRGNAKYSWLWHGDPLTPGTAATEGGSAMPPETAPTLPKIPVAVLSAREAEKLLARMGGPEAPANFSGRLPIPYRLGPGPVRVRVQLDMRNERKPIRNVIGRLRGTTDPDRWVILGTHHDAWTFGGIDPGSSAAVVIEVARRLAELRRGGWRPARSLVFAFWDAEEYGLIGSTEFAEDRARDLQERAVVYINTDMYTRGRLVAGGVPSLRDFVAEIASDSAASGGTQSSQDAERYVVGPELSALGSGADFVAFQDHLGVPTLALEFLFEGGYGFGAYHSSYDDRFYMEHVADPGFTQGAQLARLLGLGLMRLATAPVLPFRHSHYAERIRTFLTEAERWVSPHAASEGLVNTSELQALASAAADRARTIEQALENGLSAGRVPQNIGDINDALTQLEQALLDTGQAAHERWYRHVVYGWNIYSMYDGQPLPGLAEAIRLGDSAGIEREQTRLREALERLRRGLDRIVTLLPGEG